MRDARAGEADRLAAEAQVLSGRGDHGAAVRLHQRAVELCDRVLDDLRNASADDIPAVDREQQDAAHKLADHLGRLGGAYRRADELELARDAYRRGAELERKWRLDDTYCRTNAIVLALLVDPAQLPRLMGDITEVADLIRRQVDGPRRRQWWAWADLGLLSLLAGREREAHWAYGNYVGSGPRHIDTETTLDVLRDVRDGVALVSPDRVDSFDLAIRRLETARAE